MSDPCVKKSDGTLVPASPEQIVLYKKELLVPCKPEKKGSGVAEPKDEFILFKPGSGARSRPFFFPALNKETPCEEEEGDSKRCSIFPSLRVGFGF